MTMINKDTERTTKENAEAILMAFKNNDAQGLAEAVEAMQNRIGASIERDYNEFQRTQDVNALAERGYAQLTSEENKFFSEFAKMANMTSGITDISKAFPVTFIDRVLDDMRKDHELLQYVPFENAMGLFKIIVNAKKMASQLGTWGAVPSGFVTELEGKIDVADATSAKYSAFMLIPKDFARFNFAGTAQFVEKYVRTTLAECVSFGLEASSLLGDGDNQFIGMAVDPTTAVQGAYSPKTKVAVNDFHENYTDIIAGMAKDDNDDYQTVTRVGLVVNPVDYIKVIRSWTNHLTVSGNTANLLDAIFPTTVIQSAMLAEGDAVLGALGSDGKFKNYFAALNGGVSGKVDEDDHVKFIEDFRVYATRIYGIGKPLSATGFAYLDISNLCKGYVPVKLVTAAAAEASEGETEGEGAGGGN